LAADEPRGFKSLSRTTDTGTDKRSEPKAVSVRYPRFVEPTVSRTGLPTRLSSSTNVSIVNLDVFLLTMSDTPGRETLRTFAASACLS